MRKAATVLLPWTPRHERRAAIDAARQEKEQSRARAQASAKVRQDIRALYAQNHWSAAVSDALGIDRPERNGGK